MRPFMIVTIAALGCIALSSAALGVAAVAALWIFARRHAHARVAVLLLATTVGCASVVTTDPVLRNVAAQPLGFKGRVADGARGPFPAMVTSALDPAADVVFGYDERITQSHDELPFVVMMITGTVHLLGVPTGRDQVSARADLTLTRGDRELGRYRAEAKASQTYGLYYGADVLALEDQARAAVRRAIDEALSDDAVRLMARIASPKP